jgi:Putative restriction endonuclease
MLACSSRIKSSARSGDVALVVEVAEQSLTFDRTVRLFAYASGGIPVYWIVNLVDRQVELYSDPGAECDRSTQIFTPGQDIPIVIDGVTMGQVPAASILPEHHTSRLASSRRKVRRRRAADQSLPHYRSAIIVNGA